jgi:hypothetical protein
LKKKKKKKHVNNQYALKTSFFFYLLLFLENVLELEDKTWIITLIYKQYICHKYRI